VGERKGQHRINIYLKYIILVDNTSLCLRHFCMPQRQIHNFSILVIHLFPANCPHRRLPLEQLILIRLDNLSVIRIISSLLEA
jgi:hypothetical protein